MNDTQAMKIVDSLSGFTKLGRSRMMGLKARVAYRLTVCVPNELSEGTGSAPTSQRHIFHNITR